MHTPSEESTMTAHCRIVPPIDAKDDASPAVHEDVALWKAADATPRGPHIFSAEDEEKEHSSISAAERAKILADLHGITGSFDASVRISSDSSSSSSNKKRDGGSGSNFDSRIFSSALSRLEMELQQIQPESKKAAYIEACRKCPELVDDAHKTLFLRADDLDAKLAAKRLTTYWQQRRELFGPEKCFLPLTIEGALRDDVPALTHGFLNLLPHKDKFGRAIMFQDSCVRHEPSKYSVESMLRANWYLHHVALEDPEVQEKGFVAAVCLKHARFQEWRSMELQINKGAVGAVYYLPVKIRAVHSCHANAFIRSVLPAHKFFWGRFIRFRFVMHHGSDQEVLDELTSMGITRSMLPTELGGDVALDAKRWVEKRRNIEQFEKRNHLRQMDCLPQGVASAPTSARGAQSTTAREKAVQVGRKGDLRMHRAVRMKLDDPDLSRTDAILKGGFVFKGYGQPGWSDKTLFDEDGVSMAQRKNQLSRRLRSAGKKASATQNAQVKSNGDKKVGKPKRQVSNKSSSKKGSASLEEIRPCEVVSASPDGVASTSGIRAPAPEDASRKRSAAAKKVRRDGPSRTASNASADVIVSSGVQGQELRRDTFDDRIADLPCSTADDRRWGNTPNERTDETNLAIQRQDSHDSFIERISDLPSSNASDYPMESSNEASGEYDVASAGLGDMVRWIFQESLER